MSSTTPKPTETEVPAPVLAAGIPAGMLPDFIFEEEFVGFDIPWLVPTTIVTNTIPADHPRLPEFIIDE